jgi:hypothetical protein
VSAFRCTGDVFARKIDPLDLHHVSMLIIVIPGQVMECSNLLPTFLSEQLGISVAQAGQVASAFPMGPSPGSLSQYID